MDSHLGQTLCVLRPLLVVNSRSSARGDMRSDTHPEDDRKLYHRVASAVIFYIPRGMIYRAKDQQHRIFQLPSLFSNTLG